MSEPIYLRCRNKVMTYMDPKTHFKVPRGRIVKLEGKLTKSMKAWIRRGGLVVVEEALYLEQQKTFPKSSRETVPEENSNEEKSLEPQNTVNEQNLKNKTVKEAVKTKPKTTRRSRKKKAENK